MMASVTADLKSVWSFRSDNLKGFGDKRGRLFVSGRSFFFQHDNLNGDFTVPSVWCEFIFP